MIKYVFNVDIQVIKTPFDKANQLLCNIYLYLLKHWMHCLLFYTKVKQFFFSRFTKTYIKGHTLIKTCESQARFSSPARLTRIALPLNQLPCWKTKHKHIWSNQSYGFSSYVLQRYPKIWKFVVWIYLYCTETD